MREILQFLRDLSRNNNREWFLSNKQRYQQVQSRWYAYCEALLSAIGQYDSDIASLTIKDCTYRIHRDTRFSPDKSPYKTHFGAFFSKGGKRSMHAGYYFHVGTGEGEGYPYCHMLVSGNYCFEPRVIKMLREDISFGWEEFRESVLNAADSLFKVDMDGALKRVPKEYPADAPYADFMRLKSYSLYMNVSDDFLLQPDLVERVAGLFRTVKPFNDYINRAVDFREV